MQNDIEELRRLLEKNFAKKIEIVIGRSFDYKDPRTLPTNIGKMLCFHEKYTLGDVNYLDISYFSGWQELEFYLRRVENACIVLPLFLFDRSGLSIKTSPNEFKEIDPSGKYWKQVGFIYTTPKRMQFFSLPDWHAPVFSDLPIGSYEEKAKRSLEEEVRVYDSYLSGKMYVFTIRCMGEVFYRFDASGLPKKECQQKIFHKLMLLKRKLEEEVEGLEKVDVKIRRIGVKKYHGKEEKAKF